MIEKLEQSSGNIIGVKLTDKLHDEDYKHFVPMIDAAIKEHGKIRLLAWFHDFHGWDAAALWDDTKFAYNHYSSVERIAMVGETTWEKWMAKVCNPFTAAAVKYFPDTQLAEAWAWVAHESA